MKKKIEIEYDIITSELAIKESDFTTFEALGILEAAKAMITNNWLEKE